MECMQRRTLLSSLSAVGTVIIAGCGGNQKADTSGESQGQSGGDNSSNNEDWISVYKKRDFEFVMDNKNEDGEIQVQRSEATEISGIVHGFEKGDEILIVINSTDASESFRLDEEVVVGSSEQYSFSVTFDLSNQEVGDEFEISIGNQSTDGVIVEAVGSY